MKLVEPAFTDWGTEYRYLHATATGVKEGLQLRTAGF